MTPKDFCEVLKTAYNENLYKVNFAVTLKPLKMEKYVVIMVPFFEKESPHKSYNHLNHIIMLHPLHQHMEASFPLLMF